MMEDVYDLYLELDEGRTECVIQQSGMGEAQREIFLSRFGNRPVPQSPGFLRVGRYLLEGIDLKGESLSGRPCGYRSAQICNEREILWQYYEEGRWTASPTPIVIRA